jgi:hypothetical protein
MAVNPQGMSMIIDSWESQTQPLQTRTTHSEVEGLGKFCIPQSFYR